MQVDKIPEFHEVIPNFKKSPLKHLAHIISQAKKTKNLVKVHKVPEFHEVQGSNFENQHPRTFLFLKQTNHMEAMKIPKFLTWEEGGLIWEKSNYAIAFLIPKVQKGTQKTTWKL